MWKANDMISQLMSIHRSENKICMSVDQYENHTFDTGLTIDAETSSFISVDSTYSENSISDVLKEENPIYISINKINPETLQENQVIMICRCNFKKWTRDFSCFARNDQTSEEDDEDEDMFYDANETIKAEEIWVYPRDELCRMIAESKDLHVDIPLPIGVTLDDNKKLGLLQAIKIECEGREARKLLLKEENDAIQELVIRMVSKFLSAKMQNVSNTISFYTPKFIKSVGEKLVSGASGLIAWIWRHPFYCLYISSATRCIRTILCLWSNGIRWDLLQSVAMKMLERWGKPKTMFIEMCTSMMNAFFCIASLVEKTMKGQIVQASFQAISECFKGTIILVGRVGDYLYAMVEYFGIEFSNKLKITNVWTWMIENIAPSKMSTFLELDKITKIIDKPKHILVETVVLNLILRKPGTIINMVSMFTISLPAPALIQSVIELSTVGKNTIKTIEEYSAKIADILINAKQFQQALQSFIEALSDIVSYIICNIKTYYNYPNDCCSDTSNLVRVLMNMQDGNMQDTKDKDNKWWWSADNYETFEFNKENDSYFLHYKPYKNELKDEV